MTFISKFSILKNIQTKNMTTPDILVALTPVVEAFDRLLIPYYIGGSVASSIYGIA